MAKDIDTDDSGNVYVIGDFEGSEDFDPGSGNAILTSNGIKDIFIAKYNAQGQYCWAFLISSGAYDFGKTICYFDGHIFVAGNFGSGADFDPSAGVYTDQVFVGCTGMFLACYTVGSQFVWEETIQGTLLLPGGALPISVAIDNDSDIVVYGAYLDHCDFNPSAQTDTLPLPNNSNGGNFLAQYNTDGSLVYVKQIAGSNGGYTGYARINVTNLNTIVVAGMYNFTVDFDPYSTQGSFTANYNPNFPSHTDIFAVTYSNNGTYQSGFSIGQVDQDCGYDVTSDANGNIILVSFFQTNVIDVDPGVGATVIGPLDAMGDGIVSKYSPSGQLLYAFPIQTYGLDIIFGATHYQDKLRLCGYVGNTFDFDPGAPVMTATLNPGYNYFIVQYSDVLLSSIWQEENINEAGYSIYPNPAADFITIKTDVQIDVVNIYDAKGSLVQTNVGTNMIPVSNLSAGIYFVKITDIEAAQSTIRFVKSE